MWCGDANKKELDHYTKTTLFQQELIKEARIGFRQSTFLIGC